MKTTYKTMMALLLGALAFSCYYDNEEALNPGVDLDVLNDTTVVTYSAIIKPLLQTFCWQCHSNATGATEGKNIFLEDYADVKVAADDGSLYGSISWAPFYTRMPYQSSKLSATQIAQVKKWNDNDSPND